jgi:hypothetical protein
VASSGIPEAARGSTKVDKKSSNRNSSEKERPPLGGKTMAKLPSSFLNYAQLVGLDKNLADHGPLAESQLSEGFPKWIKKFNAKLKEREIEQSWKNIVGDFTSATKTDFLVSLYLYSSEKTAAYALRDRFRLLKAEIDHLVAAYTKVGKRTQALLQHPRLACVVVTSVETCLHVFQSLDLLTAARQKLETLRPIVVVYDHVSAQVVYMLLTTGFHTCPSRPTGPIPRRCICHCLSAS